MRKISEMYEWSGGTDYRHTCKECKNCVIAWRGKRIVYKCRSYGISASSATDWNAANIACRNFDRTPPRIPVSHSVKNEEIDGQMNIFDFIKEGADEQETEKEV